MLADQLKILQPIRPHLTPRFDELLTVSQRNVVDGAVVLGLKMLRTVKELGDNPYLSQSLCDKIGIRNTPEAVADIFVSACATSPELYIEFASVLPDEAATVVDCISSGRMRIADEGRPAKLAAFAAMHLGRLALNVEAVVTKSQVEALAAALSGVTASALLKRATALLPRHAAELSRSLEIPGDASELLTGALRKLKNPVEPKAVLPAEEGDGAAASGEASSGEASAAPKRKAEEAVAGGKQPKTSAHPQARSKSSRATQSSRATGKRKR